MIEAPGTEWVSIPAPEVPDVIEPHADDVDLLVHCEVHVEHLTPAMDLEERSSGCGLEREPPELTAARWISDTEVELDFECGVGDATADEPIDGTIYGFLRDGSLMFPRFEKPRPHSTDDES